MLQQTKSCVKTISGVNGRGLRLLARAIAITFAAAVAAAMSAAATAQSQNEKFYVRPLIFPDGKKAVTVAPESWTSDPSGTWLKTADGKMITLERGKSKTSGACDWSELQARFVDFPSDKNLDIDLHKREKEWYAPRGADDACMSFAISGRSGAVVMRTAFLSKGVAYGARTERLAWGGSMDAAGFVSLERDMNIIGAYFFFEGTDGYAKFEKVLAQGGALIAPASAATAAQVASASGPVATAGPVGAPGPTADGSGEAYCATGSELIPASFLEKDADMLRADKYKMNGRYAEAEEIYRGLLEKNPYDSRAGMGDVCVATGRYDEAAQNFQIALSLRPNSADAYNGLGSAYFYMSDWEAARGNFSRALQLEPDNTVSLSNMGWIALTADKDPVAAKKFFDRALQIGPEYNALSGVYSGLATVAIMNGDLDGALALCSELIEKAPSAAVAYTLRASVYLAKNEPASAYDAASRAREIAPDMTQAHAFAAEAALLLGRFADSAAAYRTAIQTSPAGSESAIPYHLGLAGALRAAGDKSAALDALRNALLLFPANKLINDAINSASSE